MRFPKTFQYIWWTLLLLADLVALSLRLGTITSTGQLQTLDTALLGAFGILALLPFFSEITILGFGAKQHPDQSGESSKKDEQQKKEQPVDNKQASQTNEEAIVPEVSSKQQETITAAEEDDNDERRFGDLLIAVSQGNSQKAEETFRVMQNAELNAVKRVQNEAAYLYLKAKSGYAGAFEQLIAFSKKHEDMKEIYSDSQRFIGYIYSGFGNNRRAIEAFDTAYKATEVPMQKARLVSLKADCLYKMGRESEAISIITSEIATIESLDAQSELYENLADLFKQSDKWELRAIAIEKAIEYRTSDSNLRFAAAYAYAEAGLQMLSLMHYIDLANIKGEASSGSGLNNLGVQYERLNMPIHAVRYYRRAWKNKETLAAANLAYQYMNAGFDDDAKQLLDMARKEDDPHPNVGSALAALSSRNEAEDKTKREILNKARQQQSFFEMYGTALLIGESECPDIHGQWKLGNIDVTITQTKNDYTAEWGKGNDEGKITGSIQRLSAKIQYSKVKYPGLGLSSSGAGFMYLSKDLQEMFHMIQDSNEL